MAKISKNILLISGSGRNVGKTSFIRNVITQNAIQKVVAIKITPHFHEPTIGLIPIAVTEKYRIFQENNRSTGKDSSLFLQAGADKVFYIETFDAYLEEALGITCRHISPEQPIVIESAALRKYLIPGLYLFIQNKGKETKSLASEMLKLADEIVYFNGSEFSLNPKSLSFDQTWKI